VAFMRGIYAARCKPYSSNASPVERIEFATVGSAIHSSGHSHRPAPVRRLRSCWCRSQPERQVVNTSQRLNEYAFMATSVSAVATGAAAVATLMGHAAREPVDPTMKRCGLGPIIPGRRCVLMARSAAYALRRSKQFGSSMAGRLRHASSQRNDSCRAGQTEVNT
jgi:hypothetical protein